MAEPLFDRLVVCGVGLIGGSFALALKAAGAVRHVVGIGRNRETVERAQRLGVVDEVSSDWAMALKGADLVMLATPVGQLPGVLTAMAPHLPSDTVVTDGGSTKQDVVSAFRAALPDRLPMVVPGHPIAGAEKSGPDAATADLYKGRRVVLTPLEESKLEATAVVRRAWEICGARVTEMTPAAHDGVFAAVSHLPHLLAFALVHELASRPDAATTLGFAAGGFRDFTRIASSHPEMWRDICLANRGALLAELEAYIAQLTSCRQLLARGDAPGLEAVFDHARTARDAWLNSLQSVNPSPE